MLMLHLIHTWVTTCCYVTHHQVHRIIILSSWSLPPPPHHGFPLLFLLPSRRSHICRGVGCLFGQRAWRLWRPVPVLTSWCALCFGFFMWILYDGLFMYWRDVWAYVLASATVCVSVWGWTWSECGWLAGTDGLMGFWCWSMEDWMVTTVHSCLWCVPGLCASCPSAAIFHMRENRTSN